MADTLADPFALPLQSTLLFIVVDDVNTVGSVTVDVAVVVQPFASVTVTVYVPATKLLFVAVVAEFDHTYVYAGVPPVADATSSPFDPPLINTLAFIVDVDTNIVGSVITTELVDVAPLASVTVTLYVPATNPVIVAVVAEFDHK